MVDRRLVRFGKNKDKGCSGSAGPLPNPPAGPTGSGKTTQVPQYILDSDLLPPDRPVVIVLGPLPFGCGERRGTEF